MKKINSYHLGFVILLGMFIVLQACKEREPIYIDSSYFSEVFKREKQYRIYLPEGYQNNDKKYPVVYHFHGWGGRHFKDDSAKLEYELIGKLVDKYQLILVMWDGNMEESEPRPYNMGYHEHMNYEQQMKDYFLELISHIDQNYKTHTGRNNRGIIGFSMGGMMSFYLAGKYPDKVSAAVNLVGSTEFYIGTPDNYTFYPLRYTFTNLSDVQIRLHNSSKGELSDLNKETHSGALWQGNEAYEYWLFEGGHSIDDPGKTDAYEKAVRFVSKAFQKPIPRQDKWSHYDLYDNFELWGYTIESDKKQPGFIFLQDVSVSGFGFYTKEWLPNGPSIGPFQTRITTPPNYGILTKYKIQDYNKKSGILRQSILKSDYLGRLQIELNSDGHEIGVFNTGDKPKLTFIDYTLGENKKILRVGKQNKLDLKILNLGGAMETGNKVKISFSSNDRNTTFEPSSVEAIVTENGRLKTPLVNVHCTKKPTKDASPPEVKIKLSMTYGKMGFQEEFSVPVFFDVPYFNQLAVDDGRVIKDTLVGKGNADGVISPGEEVLIYTNGHRTQLYFDDPYIVKEQLFDEALPAVWQTDGITFSSIIKISEDCPDNHELELLAKYETKSHMPITRRVHWGRIKLKVQKNEP